MEYVMKTRVLKFGGSSFPCLDSYHTIAAYLKSRLDTDSDRLVVVVSAMSGTTGRILEAGVQIYAGMSPEVSDSLLGTGEMVAAAFMRAALEKLGIPSDHLTGYQNGFVTDTKYTRAKIQTMQGERITKLLKTKKVVVIAGGQAINAEGKLTMLGRNSSDLSAVACAAALGLGECEIFSDVPGVFSADPYMVDNAMVLAELPYDAIIRLSRGGAKVLHHGAVEFAKKHAIRIVCRAADKEGTTGTIIGKGKTPNAIALNAKIATLKFRWPQGRELAFRTFEGQGIVSIPVNQDGGYYLAVSQENRAWSDVLHELPIDLDHELLFDLSLVTEIHEDGSIKELMLGCGEGKKYAIEAHSRMYPFRERARRVAISKRKSDFSTILTAAHGHT
jgi:aspartate kinase